MNYDLFTKRHYIAFAEVLKDAKNAEQALKAVIRLILSQPNFDVEKWERYMEKHGGGEYINEVMKTI
jgi:uncharacterized protein YlxP (DUF503 family)